VVTGLQSVPVYKLPLMLSAPRKFSWENAFIDFSMADHDTQAAAAADAKEAAMAAAAAESASGTGSQYISKHSHPPLDQCGQQKSTACFPAFSPCDGTQEAATYCKPCVLRRTSIDLNSFASINTSTADLYVHECAKSFLQVD